MPLIAFLLGAVVVGVIASTAKQRPVAHRRVGGAPHTVAESAAQTPDLAGAGGPRQVGEPAVGIPTPGAPAVGVDGGVTTTVGVDPQGSGGPTTIVAPLEGGRALAGSPGDGGSSGGPTSGTGGAPSSGPGDGTAPPPNNQPLVQVAPMDLATLVHGSGTGLTKMDQHNLFTVWGGPAGLIY
jgi:hypothetical protein